MKRVAFNALFVTLGIFIGGAFIYFATNSTTPPPPPCVVDKPCSNPYQLGMEWLPLDEALEMVSFYEKNQATGINRFKDIQSGADQDTSISKFSDTRFVTFPFDIVKQYIYNIDAMLELYFPKGRDNQYIKACDLGLRFYYGAYPGTHSDARAKEKHTLIFVPTYFDKTENMYREFFPAYKNANGVAMSLLEARKYSTPPVYETQPPARDGAANLSGPLQSIITIDLKNQGTLCPPPNCEQAIREMASNLQPQQ